MCEYCGCQDIDVIGELTAEHDRLFPFMAEDFGSPLDALVVDHRRIDAVLDLPSHVEPSDSWPTDVQAAVTELFEHILKEQDGVFPAALGTLGPAQWEAVAAVRSRVHALDRSAQSA